MSTYVRVDRGIVREVFIMPDDWDMPITQLFASAAGEWIDITALLPGRERPAYGDEYDAGQFAPPPSMGTPEYEDYLFRLTGMHLPSLPNEVTARLSVPSGMPPREALPAPPAAPPPPSERPAAPQPPPPDSPAAPPPSPSRRGG